MEGGGEGADALNTAALRRQPHHPALPRTRSVLPLSSSSWSSHAPLSPLSPPPHHPRYVSSDNVVTENHSPSFGLDVPGLSLDDDEGYSRTVGSGAPDEDDGGHTPNAGSGVPEQSRGSVAVEQEEESATELSLEGNEEGVGSGYGRDERARKPGRGEQREGTAEVVEEGRVKGGVERGVGGGGGRGASPNCRRRSSSNLM